MLLIRKQVCAPWFLDFDAKSRTMQCNQQVQALNFQVGNHSFSIIASKQCLLFFDASFWDGGG